MGLMNYDPVYLQSLIGGMNTLDVPHLNIQTEEQGREFALAYGFDMEKPEDQNKLWTYHRKAVTYIQTELLKSDEGIPEALMSQDALKDLTVLLIYASTKGHHLQPFACGILKVMHAFCHLDNDLFTFYSTQIQDQILMPIQNHIHEDPVLGTTLGSPMGEDSISLKKFEVKAFKTTSSSITKLLAKPEIVTFSLMDKVGVRFITKNLVDVFRVLRYMVEKNIVCFPHNIPDQANNTLYPLNLFLEVAESVPRKAKLDSEEWDALLIKKLEQASDRAEFKEKYNTFTSKDYRFVKFITRKLIRFPDLSLSFFYPFEVQIVDYQTHLKNMAGSASHEKYKERQLLRARARILGFQGARLDQ